MNILVAYASADGSTRSIAENIGRFLAARHHVCTASMSAVDDLTAYDAVVLGSAVHDGGWLPEAQQFVLDHSAGLSARPLWLFSVGMIDALPRAIRRFAARAEAKQLAASLPAELRPRDMRLFSGIVRREQFPSMRARVSMRLMGARCGDFRPWPEIRAWADQIALALEPARAK